MRIAMITATPQSVREGSGTYVAATVLPEALRAAGHDVRFVCPDNSPGLLGYTVHRFRFNRSLTPDSLEGSDVVVGWDMDGYRLAGRLPKPFVTYIHGQLAEEARFERGFVGASMRVQARAERLSASRADRVLTVSQFSRERIVSVYGVSIERVVVVPPPFDVTRWRGALRNVTERPDCRRPTVLTVARMYPRKNLASLVKAASRLRKQIPNLHVVIVGDGPERNRLERLVDSLDLRGTVSMLGQVNFARLVAAYASSDVFCLPSLQEGFGLVFLEAMAAGIPIVACRDTAAEELVEEGSNGLLVPKDDHEALANALGRLLDDQDLRQSMGTLGQALVEAYEPTRIVPRFVAAITL